MRAAVLLGILALIASATGYIYLSKYLGHDARSESGWAIQKNNAHSFSHKGSRINFTKTGQGSPVVLIHGGGSWGYTFRNNIDALSKSHSVYTIDIPGHGYSDVPTNWNYDLPSINDLLIDFIQHIGADKVGLVGNSWGGGWAIYFAERNPERVNTLVLIDSSGLKDSNDYDQSSWRYLSSPFGNAVLAFATKSAIENDYKTKLFYDGTKVVTGDIDEVANTFLYKTNLYAQKFYQRNLDWRLTDEALDQLKNVTVVWGRQDGYLPLSMAYEYQKRIAGARLFIVESASHLPHEEQPEVVNQILIDSFSQRVNTTPSSGGYRNSKPLL